MKTTQEAPAEAAVSDKATALFEEFKALPPAGRDAFTALFFKKRLEEVEQATQAAREKSIAEGLQPSPWPNFAGRVNAIFGGRSLGSSEEFWEEERADRC